MKTFLSVLSVIIVATMFNVTDVSAQKKVRVKFSNGASSTVLKGRIYGYQYIDYLINARERQILIVNLKSKSRFAAFVVFDPTMENLEGSSGEKEFTVELMQSGDYVVRVLLPRSQARRKGAMADFTVFIKIE